MAGPYRATFLFNGLDRGISESWFYNVNDVIQDADIVRAKRFSDLRVGLMASEWRCVAVRFTDTSALRTSTLVEYQMSAKAGVFAQGPDVASTAWMVRATGANGAKRQMWLRGGDDEAVTWDAGAKRFVVSPELLSRFEKFKTLFFPTAAGGVSPWMIGRISRLGQAGTDTQAVTNLTVSALNRPQLTVGAAPWGADERIIVSGFKQPWSYLNGVKTPKQWSAAGTVITLDQAVLGTFITAVPNGVRIRRWVQTPIAVSSLEFGRAGSRKTGRAFFVPAGVHKKR